MIAVAHGVQQHRLVADPITGVERHRVRQPRQLLDDPLNQHGMLDPPTAHPTAVQHQRKIVQALQRFGEERLDHRAPRVVDQHHDVRQLQRRALAHPNPRRQALQNGALGGPNQGLGAGVEIVVLQIQRHDQAPAGPAPRRLPLHPHQAGRLRDQDALGQIAAHGFLNGLNPLGFIGRAQINLRQDQPQRRGRITHLGVHPRPVIRLRGVLIAGDHRPFRQVHPRPGQEQRRKL